MSTTEETLKSTQLEDDEVLVQKDANTDGTKPVDSSGEMEETPETSAQGLSRSEDLPDGDKTTSEPVYMPKPNPDEAVTTGAAVPPSDEVSDSLACRAQDADATRMDRASRTRSLTEKGLQYQIERTEKNFLNSVKYHKKLVTQTRILAENPEVTHAQLFTAREDLEKVISTLSSNYHEIGEYSTDKLTEYKGVFDETISRNGAVMLELTDAMRPFSRGDEVTMLKQNVADAVRSKHGKQGSDHGSKHSSRHSSRHSSGHSSRHSSKHSSRCSSGRHSGCSTTSIKANAAAKAAALRAKLEFHDAEVEEKSKLDKLASNLDKLRLLRDIKVEEAKVAAIGEVEVGKTTVNEKATSNVCFPSGMLPNSVDSTQVNELLYNRSTVTNQGEIDSALTDSRLQNVCETNQSSNVHSSLFGNPYVGAQSRSNVKTHIPETSGIKTCDKVTVTTPAVKSTGLNCDAPVFVPNSEITPGETQSSKISEPQWASNISKNLCDFINTSRLPIPEPSKFGGDPLEYPAWKSAFSILIERHNIPPSDKVLYLKMYLKDKALESVSGYLLVPTANSYNEAMALIDKRYGNDLVVAQAFKNKIEAWPKIGNRDANALREFSDFLRQCEVASWSNASFNVLNDDMQNQKMCSKLPDWLVSRWSREIHKFKASGGTFPPFSTFVSFLTKEADIACDPVSTVQLSKVTAPIKENKVDKEIGRRTLKTMNVTPQQPSTECCFCGKLNHELNKCYKFKELPLPDRQDFILKGGFCFGCLGKGHISKGCKNRSKCDTCSKSHPTVLHGKLSDKAVVQAKDSGSTSKTGDSNGGSARQSKGNGHTSLVTHDSAVSKSTMVLPVYLSKIADESVEVLTYALLDTQSDTSFIKESTAHNLGIEGVGTTLRLSTMTAQNMMVNCRKIEGLQVRGFDSHVSIKLPSLYTQEDIPASHDCIPTPQLAEQWPYLSAVANELMPKQDIEVGLLLGYNCPQALVPREVVPPADGGPFAQKTDLGWGIVGLVRTDGLSPTDAAMTQHICSSQSGSRIVLRTAAKEVLHPSDILSFFKREEGVVHNKPFSQDDIQFLAKMDQGVRRTENGHYELPLPLRHEPQIRSNRPLAMMRLKGLVRRFEKDQQHYQLYKNFMDDLFVNNYAEEVPKTELSEDTPASYLPHHGVYNPAKPGKLRVVMDASARYFGESLNDNLLTGPDLMNTLIGVLCRFRKEHIAFLCDIKGMFQQFYVSPEHRNQLRFLWFKGGDYRSEPKDYRSTVHLFGAASSPAVANYALKRAASDHANEFGDDVVNFIQNNFYVDDGLTSVDTEECAISLINRSVQLCDKSGLKLHKFVSNSRKVLETIDEGLRADTVKDVELNEQKLPIERALGVQWCVESDTFKFRVVVKEHALTRRGVLSTVCSIFDPLGFIAPTVLEGKIILQMMCKDKLGWDEPLPESLHGRWEQWIASLPHLGMVKVDRCFKPQNFQQVKVVELHNFSDACLAGFGQCSYLRLVDVDDQVHCSLVMAKARVAPLKTVTIPRLELSAALLSAEVSQLLHTELSYEQLKCYFWTDSKIVLGFLCNDSKRFHTYVANRVQQIRDVTTPEQWAHVATDENPADIASRGANGETLCNSIWFTGPKFLWHHDISRDQAEHFLYSVDELNPEVKKGTCFASMQTESDLLSDIRHLSWRHVKHVLAICICFVENLRTKTRKSVSVSNLEDAERFLVQQAQWTAFREEILQLKEGKHGHSNAVKVSSRLFKLDPFLDEQGILRVGGRIKESHLPFENKHPIVLPKVHIITELFIKHIHEESKHQGKGLTVNAVRDRGYWVLGLSSVVSSLIFRCTTCRKQRRAPEIQKMADLPADRLSTDPAFTHVGVDLFGPFYITERRKELKRYGVLFTCLASRSVHLETANSLTADSFIDALRRFISLRGPIRTLRSDRGTNIVGGMNQLKDALNEVDDQRIRDFLLDQSCDFVLNVPNASHQGGIWERQIRTVRSVLSSLLLTEGRQLDDESLRTLLSEAASIVNSRPLSVTTLNDPTALQPLTPNHLLTMKTNIVLPPPGEFSSNDKYSRKRWRRVQHLCDVFWQRWKKEYLSQLQERQKWCKSSRNMKIGDIVLMVDDGLPRCQWKLGRIADVYPGSDNLVRKVKVLLGDPGLSVKGKRVSKSKYVERPIHKVVLLVESEDE